MCRIAALRPRLAQVPGMRVYLQNPPPIPLGRLGTPHDIADLVSFLVSDRASYITGEDINLSGGAS